MFGARIDNVSIDIGVCSKAAGRQKNMIGSTETYSVMQNVKDI